MKTIIATLALAFGALGLFAACEPPAPQPSCIDGIAAGDGCNQRTPVGNRPENGPDVPDGNRCTFFPADDPRAPGYTVCDGVRIN